MLTILFYKNLLNFSLSYLKFIFVYLLEIYRLFYFFIFKKWNLTLLYVDLSYFVLNLFKLFRFLQFLVLNSIVFRFRCALKQRLFYFFRCKKFFSSILLGLTTNKVELFDFCFLSSEILLFIGLSFILLFYTLRIQLLIKKNIIFFLKLDNFSIYFETIYKSYIIYDKFHSSLQLNF